MGQPEGGAALIVVLLVLSLLLAVVGEFAATMRLEGTTTLNFRAAVAATYLAEAAYQRAIAEILPDALAHHLDEQGRLVFRRGRLGTPAPPERLDIPLGPGRFSYRITDAEARININRAAPDLLHRLLTEMQVPREARDVITDSIFDWRDPNDEHRLNGAESDHYLALPVPYRAKNADFDSVEELLQIQGVTREIFYGRPEAPGLVEHLTVGGSGAINVNTASATVLRALGFAQAEVNALLGGRPYLNASNIPIRRGLQRTISETFRIEASGEVPRQGRRTLTAIVQRRTGRDGVVRVEPITWTWSDEAPPAVARQGT